MTTDFESDSTVSESNPGVEPTPADTGSADTTEQIQVIWDRVSGILANLPDYVTEFFKEYQRYVTIDL